MAQRTTKTKPQAEQVTEEVVEEIEAADTSTREKLLGDMDDLLDEIDGVLETNAAEFVANYVQKGGE